MAKGKKEQIKIYVTIGLAILLLISGYFRFIHGKSGGDTDWNASPQPQEQLQFDIPKVETKNFEKIRLSNPSVHAYLNTTTRDIFIPLNIPKREEMRPTEEAEGKSVQQLKLKGTIVGGSRPIAIINDLFVRRGEMIGEYKVIRISEKEVLLDSGDNKIKLEILKNE